MTEPAINFYRACPDPCALVILPWGAKGVTIAKRSASTGEIYGCRDVTFGEHYRDCLAAWVEGATADGLAIEDMRGREPYAWRIALEPHPFDATTQTWLLRTRCGADWKAQRYVRAASTSLKEAVQLLGAVHA